MEVSEIRFKVRRRFEQFLKRGDAESAEKILKAEQRVEPHSASSATLRLFLYSHPIFLLHCWRLHCNGRMPKLLWERVAHFVSFGRKITCVVFVRLRDDGYLIDYCQIKASQVKGFRLLRIVGQ